jgi:hypothetical protein
MYGGRLVMTLSSYLKYLGSNTGSEDGYRDCGI